MDPQTDVRGFASFGEMLRHANVRGCEFAAFCIGPHFSTGRLAAFLEALAKGDSAGADKVLRMWGVR